MKCIWCDLETTPDRSAATATLKFANKEHIFPESVGGNQGLEIGKVCEECNGELGRTVDCYLKTENIMMTQQYQISSEIAGKPIGKIRSKEDRAKKEAAMKKMRGYGGDFSIERFSEGNVTVFHGSPSGMSLYDYEFNQKFSIALHKCALNIIQHESDYSHSKKNHNELIKFIKDPGYRWPEVWSYAVCYRNLFAQMHFEPFWHIFSSSAQEFSSIVLVFPCAIFIVGTQPNFINPKMVEKIEKMLPENLGVEGDEFNAVRYFTWTPPDRRTQFGERFKFTYIKKEIHGEQNPDDAFYLLTKCRVCAQINPTGFMRKKDMVLEGDQSHEVCGQKNSWNSYIPEDLLKKGLKLEFWSEELIAEYVAKRGISYPIKNNVTKIDLRNCQTQCINCDSLIEYSEEDCFL